MNYNEIPVDAIIKSVASDVKHGNYRKATKKESTDVRLAALKAIHEMQDVAANDAELAYC
jgi:hypothetical protein